MAMPESSALAKAGPVERGVRSGTTPLDVLVVDDDDATRLSLAFALTDAGHQATEARDGAEALALLAERVFDAAVIDVRLPRVGGLEVFRRIRASAPTTALVVMTAFASVPDAVSALREGAYDYVTKPFDVAEFTRRVIGHIAEHRALHRELERARSAVASRDVGSPIVGNSPRMQHLVERLATVAQSDVAVLVRGESGTGKQLVARTLHSRSARKHSPFVIVQGAALSENAMAASGDVSSHGFAAHASGTLYIDEVADLSLCAQYNLLRWLDVERMSSENNQDRARVERARLVSGTRHDLVRLVAQGAFRQDLYLRLGMIELSVPPLRDRRSDLPLLVAHFVRRFYPGRVAPGIAPRAWAALMDYAFPGNVRELSAAIERALALARGSEIELEHLPPAIAAIAGAAGAADAAGPSDHLEGIGASGEGPFLNLHDATKEFERGYVARALALSHGDGVRAAELLGITTAELARRTSVINTHAHAGFGSAIDAAESV